MNSSVFKYPITCLCIDDSERPLVIPKKEWVKKGESYEITYVYHNPLLQTHSVELKGYDLTPFGYGGFNLDRFAFPTEFEVECLQRLMQECSIISTVIVPKLKTICDAAKIQYSKQ